MNIGYSDEEYARVRDWLCAAFQYGPSFFTEAEMVEKMRSGEWLLVTTPNGAAVLHFFVDEDGHSAANVLIVGGKIGGSLRELMALQEAACSALRQMNFSYICGEPRKEWHRFLLKFGFEKHGKEHIKRL
ncbi:hypothetical protein [Neorhizobium sp. NCHU2750]|uniref:hypothetical protein n=1 Tax=Neorhizobium sp. NCHU2750 TaxID=1825976 RepID=UPI000EB70662|nr:hypothetical protein NCHU2750_23560 [Neorhizobium sp. NCHU2750]